jgi:hypothetical protein
MIRKNLSPDEAIRILNDLAKCDPKAMYNLIEYRVPCNEALENHPEAQTFSSTIGLLGVLNALFGAFGPEAGPKEGWGTIAACFDDDDNLIGFMLTDIGK